MNSIQKREAFKGWTNRETWFYSLDLFNDDLSNKYWTQRALSAGRDNTEITKILAKEMREHALSEAQEITCPFLEDLIKYSIELVDFDELANELLNRLGNKEDALLH